MVRIQKMFWKQKNRPLDALHHLMVNVNRPLQLVLGFSLDYDDYRL